MNQPIRNIEDLLMALRAAQIERRLSIARDEIERARRFCVTVQNVEGDLDATVARVRALLDAELSRVGMAADDLAGQRSVYRHDGMSGLRRHVRRCRETQDAAAR